MTRLVESLAVYDRIEDRDDFAALYEELIEKLDYWSNVVGYARVPD